MERVFSFYNKTGVLKCKMLILESPRKVLDDKAELRNSATLPRPTNANIVQHANIVLRTPFY